jgi:spore coat protein U-like protein
MAINRKNTGVARTITWLGDSVMAGIVRPQGCGRVRREPACGREIYMHAFTIHGRIPPRQNGHAGSYADAVQLRFLYLRRRDGLR